MTHSEASSPILYLPGWGCDERLFDPYIERFGGQAVAVPDPFCAVEAVRPYLEAFGSAKVTLVGFSMGGHMALDSRDAFPERVERIVFIGVRPRFPEQEIEMVRSALLAEPQTWLDQFYTDVFFKSDHRAWFDSVLKRDYMAQPVDRLLHGLAYLSQVSMSLRGLRGNDVFFHGRLDKIAPCAEMVSFLEGGFDLKMLRSSHFVSANLLSEI